ncbi:MAG: primosomal protein N' [Pelolinea sp.]|nr:primosomal protein N' [Pelolinea sp.]
MFARVAVNVPEVRDLFDYAIPPEMTGSITSGSLVEVPFGSQKVQGVVTELLDQPEVAETKLIAALIDEFPVLSVNQLKLAFFLSEKYLQPVSGFLIAMLPPGLHQQSDTLFKLNLPADFKPDSLPDISRRIIKKLSERSPLRGRQLDRAFKNVDWRKSARALVSKGLLVSQPVLPEPAVHRKYSRSVFISFQPQELESVISALGFKVSAASTRRLAVMRLLAGENEPAEISWIYASTGVKSSDLRWLEQKGLIRFETEEIWRDPLKNAQADPHYAPAPVLTAEQSAVWGRIENLMDHRAFVKPVLLHGVTGSGKTELYMRAIKKALAQGQQAIVLVPEISLTPQTIERFMGRFPGKVGVIHSKLSPGERYDTWRRARGADFSIAIGPRSALFTPFPNTGVIILDECHDESYYQAEMGPSFHAVEAAIAFGKLSKALVILGTATPDVSLYFRSTYEKWPLLILPTRVAAQISGTPSAKVSDSLPLPKVEVVDMRAELREGNTSIFSRSLAESLKDVLAKQQQAILLLNRRGSASYVFCRDCGYTLKCPRCDFSLTYHRNSSSMVCHTCGYIRKMPGNCPQCGSKRIKQFGTGTEKIEADLQVMFPSARLLRWDADTSSGKGAEEVILSHFRQHNADILIGTQMLAKGLDLPLVTLVGAVLADVGLNFPDYRTAERTFQLLTQVAGRAGRSALGGKVIMQTFQPEHYAIRRASEHDFAGFYREELAHRRELRYPPFTRIVRFECRDTNSAKAQQAANDLFSRLERLVSASSDKTLEVSGPTPPYFAKRSGLFRWQVILKGTSPVRLLKGEFFSGTRIEVDPPSLL